MIKKHIVIIENDRLYSQDLTKWFISLGYKITVIEDGDVACDEIEAMAPDLIIIEMMLPGTTGDYILQHIRQCPVIKKVPVIFYTNVAVLPNSIANSKDFLHCTHVIKSEVSLQHLVEMAHDQLAS